MSVNKIETESILFDDRNSKNKTTNIRLNENESQENYQERRINELEGDCCHSVSKESGREQTRNIHLRYR